MALSAKQKSILADAYLWVTICAGALAYIIAAYRLEKSLIDHQFALIAVLTIFLSSRITIRIPQFGSQISVSDTFVRSEEHTSELQSRLHLVCRLLLEKK